MEGEVIQSYERLLDLNQKLKEAERNFNSKVNIKTGI